MSYSRFALGFSRKRRIHALSDAAFRLWVSSIDYAREELTDGEIDAFALKRIPSKGGEFGWRKSVVKELVDSGLWEQKSKDCWQIVDFLGWQPSAKKVREKRAEARERMASVRANRASNVRANREGTDNERSNEVRNGDHLSSSLLSSTEGGVGGDLKSRSETVLAGGAKAQVVRDHHGLARQWPETKRVLKAFAEIRGPQHVRADEDKRVVAILKHFAAGYSVDEVCECVRLSQRDEYWRDKGLPGILADPGRLDALRQRQQRSVDDETNGVTVTAQEASRYA